MAASTTTAHKTKAIKPLVKNGMTLVWLDDGAAEDPNSKAMFLIFFEQVFVFGDTGACLELVESAEGNVDCMAFLVSGKYGQMLVHDRIQPLPQVKDIYVFCFDIAKHNQWAQKCDKVRIVESDFDKILKQIQQDLQNAGKLPQPPTTEEQQHHHHQQQQQHQQQPEEHVMEVEVVVQEPERFIDDNNLYDQLALELLLQNADDMDGAEDFIVYCQEKNNDGEEKKEEKEKEGDEEEEEDRTIYFKPDIPLEDWYQPDLFYAQLNSTDFTQLWRLRWFIRIFYRQLTEEHNNLIKEQKTFISNYGTWLTSDELNGMKHRIGKKIIFTELLLTYTDRQKALDSIVDKKDEQKIHRVIFELNVNTEHLRTNNPYGEINKDEILFWFGSRYRLMKIELIEENDNNENSYWLIGLNLCPALDTNKSIQTLYNYYLEKLTELKDVHYAFGRILLYKGLYDEAEKWFKINNHYEELAEIALRQNQLELASQYLENLSEDSSDANLLRAYVNLLTSSEHIPKGRTLLMKICSEATDRIVRAKANIALGFINLIATQQIDQALDYFKVGSETLSKQLPDIHPDVAKSFIGIGYTYFIEHNISETEKAFQTAFQIQKQSLISNHPDFAKTRNGLGHYLSMQKQTIKQAFKEFDYAFQILIQTFSRVYKNHPEILLTKNDIERLRKGKELRPRNSLLDYI